MAEVSLNAITKSFGAVHVIKGVDLDIQSGEFVVFVGPSGCGKSTLLRLIAGLEDITSGTMKIDGEMAPAAAPTPSPQLRTNWATRSHCARLVS